MSEVPPKGEHASGILLYYYLLKFLKYDCFKNQSLMSLMFSSLFSRLSYSFLHRSIETRLQAQLSAILKLFRSLRPVSCDIINAEKNVNNLVQSK